MGILSAFRFAFQNLFFTPVLYGVIASLALFSATWEQGDRLKDRLTDPFRSQHDNFDFIIVGGGSAGSILAHRLSKFHTVLLLEAGGESHPFQAIPALSFFIKNYPAVDWSHRSVTQRTTCLACKDKRFTFSQGKNLGGSGNINYLIHLRGNPRDYDNWARITGDNRWNYDGVLQDFTVSEHFVGSTTDAAAHGVGGPLQIEMPTEIGLANEWNWAGQEMGYPHTDLNGRYDEGFDALYYPIKRGVRQATYRAFIHPIRGRKSLEIRKFAHVNKILIKDEPHEAYGVQYDRHGKSLTAFANKEVIISAGTLQTPKILMLSGIGPRDTLEPLEIPVKSDLPVGKGLQDHVSTLLGPFFINSPKTFSYDEDVSTKSFFEFTSKGTGPLTTSGLQATALLSSTYAKARGQANWPDIQLTLFGISPHRLFDSDMSHAFGLKPDVMQRYFSHARGKSAFFILVSVARPESKGEVRITSRDPYKPLAIIPNYFTDPTDKDMKVMLEGIQRSLHIAENTTVFQNCATKFTEKCFPGCEGHLFRSESYWECYVRHMTVTLNDHTGTSQMGYSSSPYAVVDSELKVMGISNLRVVDASVMPTIVGANTQAATMMIAEKASEFILEQWKDFGPRINFDHEFSQGYGPPTLPQSYGPPEHSNQSYGPPKQHDSGFNSHLNEQLPHSGTVVIDDSLGSLTPPGLPEQDPYFPNYDSLELLRNKGLDAIQQINLGSSDAGLGKSIPLPEVSSTLSPPPYPVTLADEFIGLRNVSTFLQIYSTSGNPWDAGTPESFTTPALYQEVYDPTTPSSTTGREREPKYFDFQGAPDNLINDPGKDETSLPTTLTPDTEDPSSSTASVLMRGPNGSSLIIRKRKRPRPPNVTVHPRGHLGYEDEDREPNHRKTTQPTISTSIDPLPKDYVVVKQRRPGFRPRRKRLRINIMRQRNEDDVPVIHTKRNVDGEAGGTNLIAVSVPLAISSANKSATSLSAEEENALNSIFEDSSAEAANSTESESSLHSTAVASVVSVLNRLRNFIPPLLLPILRGNGIDDRNATNSTTPSHTNDPEEVPNSNEQTTPAEEANNDQSETSATTTVEGVELSDVDLNPARSNNSSEEKHPYVPVDMDPLPKIIARTTSRFTNNRSILIRNAGRRVRTQNGVTLDHKPTNATANVKTKMAKFVRRQSYRPLKGEHQ